MRGNDAAGLVEIGELQRNGGADDRLLPIVGDRQPAHPFHPVVVRAFEEIAAGFLQVAGERLVGTEHQMQRPGHHEGRLAVDHRQRRIGGQADGGAVGGIADMIAAERTIRNRLAVIVGRPHSNGDARQAGNRLDDAKDLRRPKHAAELAKAGSEIGDLDLAAVTVGEHGAYDRAVADIFGSVFHHVLEHDVGKSFLLLSRHQPAEDRIAVEARIAPPYDPRARIDQGGQPAVADDPQIEPMIDRAAGLRQLTALRGGHPVLADDR